MMQVGRQKCLPLVFRRDNRGVLVVSWRKIPIALVDKQKGEQTAQAMTLPVYDSYQTLIVANAARQRKGGMLFRVFLRARGRLPDD